MSVDVKSMLLAAAYRHRINQPTIEAAFEQFNSIAGSAVAYHEFCQAVAECLAERLIHEPVRLPEGALQCHWHLQLTPAGTAFASRIAGSSV